LSGRRVAGSMGTWRHSGPWRHSGSWRHSERSEESGGRDCDGKGAGFLGRQGSLGM